MPKTKEQFNVMRNVTKDKIIAAGLKLFSHKGLAATSINDIASHAGISTGLLYHYYKSKEDLFNELTEITVNAAKSIDSYILNLNISPAEKMKLRIKEILDKISNEEKTAQYIVLMAQSLLAGNMPERSLEIREKEFESLDLLAKIITEGQKLGEFKQGNPYEMALLYFSVIQGLASYKLMMGDKFVTPSAALITTLFIEVNTKN